MRAAIPKRHRARAVGNLGRDAGDLDHAARQCGVDHVRRVQHRVDRLDFALFDFVLQLLHLIVNVADVGGVVAAHHLERERVTRDAQIRRRVDRLLDHVVDAVLVASPARIFVAVGCQQNRRGIPPAGGLVDGLQPREAGVGDVVVDHHDVDLLFGEQLGGRGGVGKEPQAYTGDGFENPLMMAQLALDLFENENRHCVHRTVRFSRLGCRSFGPMSPAGISAVKSSCRYATIA